MCCRLRGSARCRVASPPAELETVFQETSASPEQTSEAAALPYHVPKPKKTVIVRGELCACIAEDLAKSSGMSSTCVPLPLRLVSPPPLKPLLGSCEVRAPSAVWHGSPHKMLASFCCRGEQWVAFELPPGICRSCPVKWMCLLQGCVMGRCCSGGRMPAPGPALGCLAASPPSSSRWQSSSSNWHSTAQKSGRAALSRGSSTGQLRMLCCRLKPS